ncbi:MAG: GNAT family N-acetyltransferase [Thiothrix sp.]|nr:MAG: GNAT family N-acetyltransferase [Thiothrix sp.]
MITVLPLAETHFDELYHVLDTVAREQRFLALTQAPSKENTFAFYRSVLKDGQCHVAMQNGKVVGWCDILPSFGEARQHVGTLGIGLLPSARHQGIGRQLMQAAIETAWNRGLTRIELTVREDNHNAKQLYEQFRFETEGLRRNSMLIDGQYFHCYAMALLRNENLVCK